MEPDYIVQFKKERYLLSYLIRWKQSVVTREMLGAPAEHAPLVMGTWTRRPRSRDSDRGEEVELYDVVWKDTWLPCWMVRDATLIHDFWTYRYRDRERQVSGL